MSYEVHEQTKWTLLNINDQNKTYYWVYKPTQYNTQIDTMF